MLRLATKGYVDSAVSALDIPDKLVISTQRTVTGIKPPIFWFVYSNGSSMSAVCGGSVPISSSDFYSYQRPITSIDSSSSRDYNIHYSPTTHTFTIEYGFGGTDYLIVIGYAY